MSQAVLPNRFHTLLGLSVVFGTLAIYAAAFPAEYALGQERPRIDPRERLFNRRPPKPWAIILCRFSDLPDFEPFPVEFYEECFTELGAGMGREFDYFREVTYGAYDLTGSRVFGWFTMRHHQTKELTTLKYPSGRATLHDWGIQAAKSRGVDLKPFYGVAVFFNSQTDSGSSGGHRVVMGYKNTDWLPSANMHEFGHGFELGHSWSARPDVVYGDRWDIMSAMRVYTFKDKFGRANGPGMNACNLRRLGCIPRNRIWSLAGKSGTQTFTLAALNRPEARGFLMASIPPVAGTKSACSYVIEFRQKKGWDAGIPRDTVLVHEVRSNGTGYLLSKDEDADADSTQASPNPNSRRNANSYEVLPGEELRIPVRQVTIRVRSFDSDASTAQVSITPGPTRRPLQDVKAFDCLDSDQNKQAHVWDVKFSSDSRLLLGAGDAGPSGAIHIWDVATGKESPTLLPGKKVWFSTAVFTPDGKQVVSCYSQDNQVYIWDAATGKLRRHLVGLAKPATSVAVSPDGRLALAGSQDQTLLLWDLENGQELHRLSIRSEHGIGTFSPDSKSILTYGDDPTLRLWDVKTGSPRHELAGHSADCSGLFSRDGLQVLSFSADKTVRLWDAATGRQIRLFEGCADVVLGAAFLPPGGQIAVWGKDGMLRVWDAGSGRELRTLDLGKDWKRDARAIALSQDGRRLLTNHEDHRVHLRDLSTGAELHRYANVRNAKGLTFSPDGRFAASGSFRAGVYLLRLPE